jgi:16S rRNA (guanine527-N7)-methyltransferase
VRRAAGDLAGFLAFLREENETTNLVSSRAAEPHELVSRHLLDSLLGLSLLPPPAPVPVQLLDIGSGGGFPALPLLLVRRDVAGTLVESTGKKCAFLAKVCRHMALTAEVVNARFPDSFQMKGPARYDVLTSRAVHSAGRLVRAARPLLAPSARALLWTTEPLFPEAVRESGASTGSFHLAPGADRRGIAVLEGFT